MKRRLTSLFVVLCMLTSLFAFVPATVSAADDITVILNGQKLEFDVPPQLMNDRTMVPMRAIFEALDTTVYWNDSNETVSAYSSVSGTIVLPIGGTTATVNGEAYELDQPAVLKDGRTLVPIRFVAESLGATVGWIDATQTVTIDRALSTDNADTFTRYYPVSDCYDLGVWTVDGDGVIKGRTTTKDGETLEIGETDGDAKLIIDIPFDGTYKIWGLSKDYKTNQPGTRFFHIAVDGQRSATKFGAHGKEGFAFSEVGVYELTKGQHTISFQDTSRFFARAGGVMVTPDVNFVPADTGYMEYYQENSKTGAIIPANYPQWAKGQIADVASETIGNDKVKIEFYQGTTDRGTVIQNRVLINKNGNWVEVKGRNEDLGVLAMRANDAPASTTRPPVAELSDTPWHRFTSTFDTHDGALTISGHKNFYKTGAAEWLIPSSMQKVDDKTVVLGLSNNNVDATLTYTYDDLTSEPKVTFDATIKTAGAYSFAHFTGSDFKDGTYDRVVAPLMYTKDFVPQDDAVLAEYMMFTPMVAFTFGEGANAITKGIVVDPTFVRQDVATPGRSDFGILFRSPTGDVRGQIVAPLFGSENAIFNAGDKHSFGFRLIYNDSDWYDNYKHIAQDIYNCVDLRTNLYHSLNDAIYNATDLIMDDTYGGWDDKDMGFYNMEAKMVTTQSNVVELMQRYMLTDNEEILTERAIPSIAFMITRGGMHFKRVEGNNSYTGNTPVPLSGFNNGFGPSSYLTLYRMSQGRTPFLMNQAVAKLGGGSSISNVTGYAAFNDMMDGAYIEEVKAAADKYIDGTLKEGTTFYSKPYGGFIYSNDVPMLQSFMTAYEATGDKKYLDAAEEIGQIIMMALWTTGYQNDYATTDYTVTPETFYSRPMANDKATWYFHKDGTQWRVGNPVGVNNPVFDPEQPSVKLIETETGPGWVPARAGMSTEHTMTPSNGNAITMNMWAGTGLRLGEYTGDDFFITQARNAMIGRFGNYAGYYYERYSFHDKKANYPIDGPDSNLIYWHHIPVFLGLMEDFLINNIWQKSGGKVTFPTAVNQGYAYFVTNQYGFDAGKFYDEDGMWMWLDRGIVQPDSSEIDYLPAKKDGVLGVAFVNESDKALTTTITLGDKIPNAASYNETATLLDKDGNKSTVEIVNGKFTLTIPAKGIQSVILHPDVKVPSYVREYTPSQDMGNTVVSMTDGKAYLMQFNDNSYYAYMYTTKMAKDVKDVTFTYTVDGKTESRTITEYPFETIVKVDKPTKDFSFKVTATAVDGKTIDLGDGVLSPAKVESAKAFKKGDKAEIIKPNIKPFENYTVDITSMGTGTGVLRFVTQLEKHPFGEIKANGLAGLKIKGVMVDKASGKEVVLESMIVGNEIRANDHVLIVEPTDIVPLQDYRTLVKFPCKMVIISPDKDYDSVKLDASGAFEVGEKTEAPKTELPDFDSFSVSYTTQGVGASALRFVVPLSNFKFELSENILAGYGIKIVMKDKATGEEKTYNGIIDKNEMRETATVLQLKPIDGLKAADYDNDKAKTHKFTLTILKKGENPDNVQAPSPKDEEKAPASDVKGPEKYDAFSVKPTNCGELNGLRLVCNRADFPFEVAPGMFKGVEVELVYKDLNGKEQKVKAPVINNEDRSNPDQLLVVVDCKAITEAYNSDQEWQKFKPTVNFPGK